MNLKIVLVVLPLFLINFLSAQILDPSLEALVTREGEVNSILVQDDGKILVAGSFDFSKGDRCRSICRFNADGTQDLSFNAGKGANGAITSMIIQSDGKIVIVGSFDSFNDNEASHIARLNPDGTYDNSFQLGTGFDWSADCIVSDELGKLYIGGPFTEYNGLLANGLIRLLSNGSVDETFTRVLSSGARICNIGFHADGKIVMRNVGSAYMGVGENILRLENNGNVDTTFELDISIYSSGIIDFEILPDNRILLLSGNSEGNAIIICQSNGVEESYQILTPQKEKFQQILPDGKGNLFFGDEHIYQYNIGTNTTAIYYSDEELEGNIFSFGIHPDGSLLAGGAFYIGGNNEKISLVKFKDQFEIDDSFNVQISNAGSIDAVVAQDNGKIYIGGDFSIVNGKRTRALARLNANGTLDESFFAENLALGVRVYDVLVPKPGLILASGWAHPLYDELQGIQGFDENGNTSTEFLFDSAEGAPIVWNMYMGTDDFIYVETTRINVFGILIPDLGIRHVARLNLDGSIEPTFYNDNFDISVLGGIAFTPNDKIYISAHQIFINGGDAKKMYKLNLDFSIDESFTPVHSLENSASGSAEINDMVELDNGKLLVVGDFTEINGIEVSNGIARLIADGSVDETFDAGSGFVLEDFKAVRKIQEIQKGKFILHGAFSHYQDIPVKDIVVIDEDGNLQDCSFAPLDGLVNDLVVIDPTTVLAAGNFTLTDESDGISVARFIDLCETPTAVAPLPTTTPELKIFPNPTQQFLTFETAASTAIQQITIVNSMGSIARILDLKNEHASQQLTIDVKDLPAGIYTVKMALANGAEFQKIIKL